MTTDPVLARFLEKQGRYGAHTKKTHACPHCGRKIKGNGFTNHLRMCSYVKAGVSADRTEG